MTRAPARLVAGLLALTVGCVLAGCAFGGASGPSQSAIASTPAAASTSAPVDAAQVGTCTASDSGDSVGPMVFTVATDTGDFPIQLSYPAFNRDGTIDTVTETATGPLIVRTSYPCTDAALSASWVTEATSETTEHLSCSLSNGGNLITTEQRWHHGALDTLDVLCQGHPTLEVS